MEARLLAVDGVEVAADDARPAVPARAGSGLGVADDAVAAGVVCELEGRLAASVVKRATGRA